MRSAGSDTTVHRAGCGNGERRGLEPPGPLCSRAKPAGRVYEADLDGVAVVHAPGDGDDTIVAIAESHSGVVVVTDDRALAARVRSANGTVVGPSWLLDQLLD